MAVEYKLEEFKLPVNGQLQSRQKIKIVHGRLVNLNELSQKISESCSVSHADVAAVSIALYDQIRTELLNGNIVDLGELGTLRIRANNRNLSVEDEKELGRKIPIRIRLFYQNPKLLKELVNRLKFTKQKKKK